AFALVWWRGTQIALTTTGWSRVFRSFRLGVLAYIFNLALAAAAGVELPDAHTFLLFLALGILLLAYSRQLQTFGRAENLPQLQWLGMTLTFGLGLIGLVTVLSLLLGRQLSATLFDGIQLLEIVLSAVLYVL